MKHSARCKNEVHVQEIWHTYDRLVRWCRKHPNVMLMLTAQKDSFGFLQHHKTIIENYKKLKTEASNPLGIHVHMPKGSLDKLTYEQQYEYLRYGKELLEKEAGIEVKDFTAGWSHYNDITVKACKEVGLTNFHYHTTIPPLRLEGMAYIPYRKFIHDFQITEAMLK